MENIPENPIIRNYFIFGNPSGEKEHIPICPICGEEAEKLYENSIGDIVGCNICIEEIDAWDWDDEGV